MSTATNTNAVGGVPQALLNAVNPKAKTATDSVQAEQDKFMTLLITQLKNQDPMNPLDNAQVTSQLAQLSTVSGINKLNDTLGSLKADYQNSASLQATNLINHGVLVEGNGLRLADSKGIFGVEIVTPADSVQVDIRNAAGKVVHTMTMKNVDAGVLPLGWDGTLEGGTKAPDGNYTVAVKAMLGEQELRDAKSLTFGTVASVSTGAAGVKLNIPTIGQVAMDAVKQVL